LYGDRGEIMPEAVVNLAGHAVAFLDGGQGGDGIGLLPELFVGGV
jgi:hypothetical protein